MIQTTQPVPADDVQLHKGEIAVAIEVYDDLGRPDPCQKCGVTTVTLVDMDPRVASAVIADAAGEALRHCDMYGGDLRVGQIVIGTGPPSWHNRLAMDVAGELGRNGYSTACVLGVGGGHAGGATVRFHIATMPF